MTTDIKMSREVQSQGIKALARMLPKQAGRKIAAGMLTRMLNQFPDVKSVGREALAFYPVENSNQAVLTSDVEIEAFVIADTAEYPVNIHKNKKVLVPQIHLASNLDMTVMSIKDSTYDLPGRVKEMVRMKIIAKEDELIFKMFAKVSANNTFNPSMSVVKANFDINTVIDAASNIEGQDLEPASIFINSANLGVFKKAGFDFLDDQTKREYMNTGVVSVVNGLKVYKSRFVPKNTVYITATKEQTGVVFEAIPLTIFPADDQRNGLVGFGASQHAGYCISNQRAIQEIKLI